MFIDLSHELYDKMPGYEYNMPDGTIEHFTLNVNKVVDRESTKSLYDSGVEFLLSKVTMHTAIGTYLDAPFHRFHEGKDYTDYSLKEFILKGIVIDLSIPKDDDTIIQELNDNDVDGKAVLFYFGMAKYWGTVKYFQFESVSEVIIDKLIELNVKMVGVDTINVDKFVNKHRPAHTKLLADDILIIENLKNLEVLIGKEFRLFAVPLSIRGIANFPIRAFAETK